MKEIHEFESDYEALFFEVSSHALHQQRLYDLKLQACAWTSFSIDHLDYHGTEEEYFKAKTLIAGSCESPILVSSLQGDLLKRLKDSSVECLETNQLRKVNLEDLSFEFMAHHNQSNLEVSLGLIEEVFGSVPDDLKNLTLLSN